MISEEEKKGLMEELDSLKATMHDLKGELDSLNKEKERWMDKKNSFKNEILSLIGNVKGLKSERNNLTTQVKMSKQEREKVDKKIPELLDQLEKLKVEKNDLSEKLGLRKDAVSVKKEIDAMRQKLETEPMSFNAEKKLMQSINQKKKELESAGQVMDIVKKIRVIQQELDMYKKIRSISHSKVQSIAKNSQVKHENMIEESKKIDELKAKEQEAYEKFKEIKDKYKGKSDELKDLLHKITGINKKFGVHDKEQSDIKEKQQKKTLAQKRKEVEGKLANGEKLTTEDLLVLQS